MAKHKSTLLQSTSLLLMLFLHSVLISPEIGFGCWLLSLIWSLLALLVVPKLFYQIDRASLSRQVSAAIVLLSGLVLGLSFLLIERSIIFYLDDRAVQKVVMFIFLSTLVARIENVYDMKALTANKMTIFLTIIIVLLSFLIVRYSVLIILPYMYEKNLLHLASWTFWQSETGRLLTLLFWLIGLDFISQLVQRSEGGQGV